MLLIELPRNVHFRQVFAQAKAAHFRVAPGVACSFTRRFDHCIRLQCGESWSPHIAELLAVAGYDPLAMVRMLRKLAPTGVFSSASHPVIGARIENVLKSLATTSIGPLGIPMTMRPQGLVTRTISLAAPKGIAQEENPLIAQRVCLHLVERDHLV